MESSTVMPAERRHMRQRYAFGEGTIQASRFTSETGADEVHLALTPAPGGNIDACLRSLELAYLQALDNLGLREDSAVFKRFYLSDIVNQYRGLSGWSRPLVRESPRSPCAASVVGQPPLSGGKVALWAYHIQDNSFGSTATRIGPEVMVRRNGLRHCWTAGMVAPEHAAGSISSYDQTETVFRRYRDRIAALDMNLRDHVIRTWLYVQNVDVNYGEVVRARRDLFETEGLTAASHFITSTGIEGKHHQPGADLLMDAYAVGGIEDEQVSFLRAPGYMNPTHEYGVTFERGTRVDYGDRRHLFVSGTASIDNTGAIVHEGDVYRQMLRALENTEAILADGGGGMEDVVQMTVYLRDPADREIVREYLNTTLPEVPYMLVLAPVCRPGWLIEFECMAIVSVRNERFADF